jgi:hypothetical protein
MLAARDQADIDASPCQLHAHIAADCTGAEYTYLHLIPPIFDVLFAVFQCEV